MSTVLCPLESVEDGASKGFSVDGKDIFIVRQGGQVFGYVNACPHIFASLEFMPDEFLDDSGEFIVCATHGALFRIEDGECIAGPCKGDMLTPVPVSVRDGEIQLD
ncbi:MAG: Rieske (2Fe-2S) protein [Alphaproteobacteria bacterium]|nr:Rieske (2Fe-2S) protein [Alphaproteobacteria bacterium]MBU0796259.1 Rieske (2Fe-2S) protein [Alphaproteobacteria bacterium]MBU0887470.1 Rieske (2Fe-2S) protein [Alphaproteobacteria bacterium]MBU1813321.1 Rieske (2Fe-2S) protein [Alphaproteobacteria bacterium]